MAYNKNVVRKALVSLSIEKALLGIGKETHDKVVRELYKRYHSYLPNCYEHPEYLSEILKKLNDNTSKDVAGSIKKQLEEFSYYQQIARFLEIISQ